MNKAALSLSIVVGIMSVQGVGFSILFLFTGGANEGFEQFPNVTLAHVRPPGRGMDKNPGTRMAP